MKITKLGHCCLLIETKGVRILTDPGVFTTTQNDLTNIDLLLITHEHADHFHMQSVVEILGKNPSIKIVTNASVGKLLAQEKIEFEVVADGQSINFKDVAIEGHGSKHAIIYGELGQVENTGFFVDGKLFYPGDALYNPNKVVDVLALPVAGPWVKLSESIDYAKAVKPRLAFPVHDAVLKFPNMSANWLGQVLPEAGIEYHQLDEQMSIDVG
jgi:L-ascorbate metabolism protein UlaG (beta-lactamase superfamily)